MKTLILTVVAAAAVVAQQQEHKLAGDDVRGYSDTPKLPGQQWKVHDMERPRPPRVIPGPYVHEAPPSDAIVLFDGEDLSKWVQLTKDGKTEPPQWTVQN